MTTTINLTFTEFLFLQYRDSTLIRHPSVVTKKWRIPRVTDYQILFERKVLLPFLIKVMDVKG